MGKDRSQAPPSPLFGRRNVVLVAAGMAIGFLAAFLGIGGGVAVVPLLVLGYGLDQRKASGTSLGVVTFVVSTGIVIDVLDGSAESRPAVLAVLLIVPLAVLAAHTATPWIRRVPVLALRRVFAAVMLAAAARLFGLPPFDAAREGGVFVYAEPGAAVLVALPLLGICIGTISTLIGIGGGLLVIPALGLLFADLTWLQCRATSLLIVAPTAFMGFSRHLAQGTADLAFVRPIAPACIVGSVLGSFLAHRTDPAMFQHAFGVVLVLVAVKLAVTGRSDPDRAV